MKEIKNILLGKVVFWVCLSVSVILIIAGFIAPPVGSVEPSVLTAVGEIFAFATLGVVADAIKEGYEASIKRGEIEIELSNKGK